MKCVLSTSKDRTLFFMSCETYFFFPLSVIKNWSNNYYYLCYAETLTKISQYHKTIN